ncbi:phytanoyl-CoA dioxygenase [Talaromyces proteolyticus]|uniref:Phytanoyl-CoA dioxygenase n=1 Tax=Talaromyces proteolyticus TaxID=1131652 RepID=A0AAD4KIJ4_9EURO|nr:phytanoyl-CoA dioxygenase [Talaromyces proteolyticus]KAH8693053.1 phytanoyl-CoA dioxygenase [Talaromyces proteolyticus]
MISTNHNATNNTHTEGTAPKGPVTEVPELCKDASAQEVEDALKLAGCCLIRNFVSKDIIDQINSECRPTLEQDGAWEGSFFPKETRRAYGLVGLSPTWVNNVLMHPVYQKVCTRFLTIRHWNWSGNRKLWATSRPIINATSCFSIRPGSKAQELHRDDTVHHNRIEAVDVYPEDLSPSAPKRETSLALFLAGTKATKENGATECIPGSHLWSSERMPNADGVRYAAMEPGDAFLMLGSTYHAGGQNTTKDSERLIHATFMCRGILRSEENQFLTIPIETMKERSPAVQKITGYSVSEPFCGWVGLSDPRRLLDPTVPAYSDHQGALEDIPDE